MQKPIRESMNIQGKEIHSDWSCDIKVGALWMLMERWEGPHTPSSSHQLNTGMNPKLYVNGFTYYSPSEVVTIIFSNFKDKETMA